MTEICIITNAAAQNYLVKNIQFIFYTTTQWLCLMCLAICLPLYLYASFTIWKTHREFTFDSGVMLVGAVLNMLVLINIYGYCTNIAVIIQQEIEQAILLIFCLTLARTVFSLEVMLHRRESTERSMSLTTAVKSQNSKFMKFVWIPFGSAIVLLMVVLLVRGIVMTAKNHGQNTQSYDWIWFLIIDWLLSIAIVTASCKAEQLLRTPDSTKLESDLVSIRQKQLKTVAFYFLSLNCLYGLFLLASLGYDNKKACFNECAEPTTDQGGVFLGIKEILRLMSIEFYLYAFWYLPSRLTYGRQQLIDMHLGNEQDQLDIERLTERSVNRSLEELPNQVVPMSPGQKAKARQSARKSNNKDRRVSKRFDSLAENPLLDSYADENVFMPKIDEIVEN